MILGIDHVGLVTAVPEQVGVQLRTLGLDLAHSGKAEAYGVHCEFWSSPGVPDGTAIEVVSPSGPGSAVDSLLRRDGPGLYHVAFAVDHLKPEADRLRKGGFIALDPEAREGARPGMKVMFMYMPEPADILIELVHYAGTTRRKA